MIDILVKCYYGAWQSFYHIDWPVRFLIEWAFFLSLLFLVVVLIRAFIRKWKLKNLFVKGWCIGIREIVYFWGHEKEWAVIADNRMIDWALIKMGDTGSGKKHHILYGLLVFAAVIIYFLAVFVDLPVAGHISEEYLSSANNIKTLFVQIETLLSNGYEQYPPLFAQKEEYEEAVAEEVSSETEERKAVFIQLNDRGKNGSNIRSEPDLSTKGNIIGGVNKDSEILYGDEWTYDGERYWIRVYIPADGIVGWLSGNLVDSGQLNDIVEGKTE